VGAAGKSTTDRVAGDCRTEKGIFPQESGEEMPDTKSGNGFLQRIGMSRVYAPAAEIEPVAHKAHQLELEAPLPLPELVEFLDGDPPPDRGVTEHWPHNPAS
jgi:hypothetical protein